MRYPLFVLLCCQIAAAAPTTINYSAFLTDVNKKPRAISDFITFRLFDDSVGGTKLWEEELKVVAPNGFVSVVLGAKTIFPIRQITRASKLFLEMQIGSETPFSRQKLSSSFFAFNAAFADSANHSMFADSANYSAIAGVAKTVIDSAVVPAKINAAGATKNQTLIFNGNSVNWALPAVVTAGAGLTSTINAQTESLAISFGGTGAATTASRSDHSHDSRYGSKSRADSLESRIAALEEKLRYVTSANNTIYIDSANLCIRNGKGATDSVNGLGNLVVGYDEPRPTGSAKTGSHNIVAGKYNNYTRHGGLVVGYNNSITNGYASVSGGQDNTASGGAASVSGGNNNTAAGPGASISGGRDNIASHSWSSVSGGKGNTASGAISTVSGGQGRTASGTYNWVAGSLTESQ